MSRVGRETKLDDLVEKRICDALRDGHSYAAAARAGGIHEDTLHYWRERGRKGEPRYSEFSERIERADQEAEDRCVQVLKDALSSPDKKLATDTAWKWLARRRPQQWAERKPEPEERELSLEEAERLIAEAAALARRTG